MKVDQSFDELLSEIRSCKHCEQQLSHGARPIVSASPTAKVLIVGQAPGLKVHESGIPWNDPSGRRLREWMGISEEGFYDASQIAIVPMGFCYPGKGKSGDLPPRPECAELWHDKVLSRLTSVQLTMLVGTYAQNYVLGAQMKSNLTETVKAWNTFTPKYLPLPHPSPRNRIWLAKNEWFEKEILPWLQKQVKRLIRD